MPFKFLSPTPYSEIKDMVTAYFQTMNAISKALEATPAGVQLNIVNEPIGFYISKDQMKNITTTIAGLPGFDSYLALFGIEKESDNLTLCIVGADANGKILDAYKDDSRTYGEEKWPYKCPVALSHSLASLTDFLTKK